MTERDPSVSLVTQARKSVTALRDAARQGGMDHRVRDPHVISIHAALDALEREAASRLAEGMREDLYKSVDAAFPPASPAATSARFIECEHCDGYGRAPRLSGSGGNMGGTVECLECKPFRLSAAERPAQTCATCKHYDESATSCFQRVTRPFPFTKQQFGCTLHEPAPPGPGAQEKEKCDE